MYIYDLFYFIEIFAFLHCNGLLFLFAESPGRVSCHGTTTRPGNTRPAASAYRGAQLLPDFRATATSWMRRVDPTRGVVVWTPRPQPDCNVELGAGRRVAPRPRRCIPVHRARLVRALALLPFFGSRLHPLAPPLLRTRWVAAASRDPSFTITFRMMHSCNGSISCESIIACAGCSPKCPCHPFWPSIRTLLEIFGDLALRFYV